jgi:hypothetical protein|tara:strand:+ start:231 stop:476 length:246 start_codon:yes stop_codon:yes gene_type:complete
MKDKNKQSDYDSMTLEELTNEANRIINFLENHENIENETESYQNLLKLNGYIEKKFSSNAKNINIRTKEKIISLSSKKNAN